MVIAACVAEKFEFANVNVPLTKPSPETKKSPAVATPNVFAIAEFALLKAACVNVFCVAMFDVI